MIYKKNVIFYCIERHFKKLFTVIITGDIYTENALLFRWTLMTSIGTFLATGNIKRDNAFRMFHASNVKGKGCSIISSVGFDMSMYKVI